MGKAMGAAGLAHNAKTNSMARQPGRSIGNSSERERASEEESICVQTGGDLVRLDLCKSASTKAA